MANPDKKQLAIEFINALRDMEAPVLHEMIAKEAGEELAGFFLNYVANLISRDPERVLENTSSLMLMGYLIRAHEEQSRFVPANTSFTPDTSGLQG